LVIVRDISFTVDNRTFHDVSMEAD